MNIEGKNPSDFLKMMHHFSGKRLYLLSRLWRNGEGLIQILMAKV